MKYFAINIFFSLKGKSIVIIRKKDIFLTGIIKGYERLNIIMEVEILDLEFNSHRI